MGRILLLKKHAVLLVFILFISIMSIIVLGCVLLPSVFYDQWIWKYYWGPVVADATGGTASYHGVIASEGYTLVSEITYGIILVCALYGLYKLLKKLEISIDWWFCLALMPYILFGPVTRVLEDTSYYTEPAVYWFISPLIYFQTTAYVLIFLFLGRYLEKRGQHRSHLLSVLFLLLIFMIIDAVYTVIWILGIPYGASRIEPQYFVLLSLIAFVPILYRSLRKQRIITNTVIFSGGLLVLLPCVFLIGEWMMGHQWSTTEGARFDVFLLIIGIVSFIVFMVYLIAMVFRKHEQLEAYRRPLNLSMLTGHLIDGFTSYISIYDPLRMGLPSYIEKHPASNGLMELWPPLFPIVKFLLIIVAIYLFDVLYKKELQQYTRLVNLIKIGIFILGVSPGLRDLLRVTMGV